MPKVSNVDARRYITNREPFKTNSGAVYYEAYRNIYAVFSYGYHYPMWVYDYAAGQWFGNADSSTRTTNKQKSQTRPRGVDIHMVSTDELVTIITHGGYADACADRMVGAADV